MSTSFNATVNSVNLPNPTFADSKNASVQLSIRRTLANTQRTIITSSAEQQFNITYANLTLQQKNEFEIVLNEISTRGVDVSYTDLDGVDWNGEIVNWPFDFVETYTRSRGEGCINQLEEIGAGQEFGNWERRYSCTVVFRGILA